MLLQHLRKHLAAAKPEARSRDATAGADRGSVWRASWKEGLGGFPEAWEMAGERDSRQGAALIHASTPASIRGGQLAQAGTTVIFKSLGKKTIINNGVRDGS